ncbi:MAG: S-layer homology domain-containing protein, partial [Thermacetogeniaceae bacterium]
LKGLRQKESPDGTFKPGATVTRAEFATMLVNALGQNTAGTTGQFTDVTPDSWCYNSVNTAVYAGLVSGTGDHLFAPNAAITREQMAVMVAHALGTRAPTVDGTELTAFSDRSAVSSWAVTGMEEGVKSGIVSGMNTDTLAPDDDATRAQAAVMIYKMLTVLGK